MPSPAQQRKISELLIQLQIHHTPVTMPTRPHRDLKQGARSPYGPPPPSRYDDRQDNSLRGQKRRYSEINVDCLECGRRIRECTRLRDTISDYATRVTYMNMKLQAQTQNKPGGSSYKVYRIREHGAVLDRTVHVSLQATLPAIKHEGSALLDTGSDVSLILRALISVMNLPHLHTIKK